MRGKGITLAALGLTALITAASLYARTDSDCCDARAEGLPPAWVARVRTVNEAIEARDVARAARTWRDAWGAALASRRWEALLAAGDAALRVGDLTRAPGPARADARQAYHAALFRAYGERSSEGVLRTAEAMAGMGDRELASAALHLARKLAEATQDAQVREGIERDLARIADRLAARGSISAAIAALPASATTRC